MYTETSVHGQVESLLRSKCTYGGHGYVTRVLLDNKSSWNFLLSNYLIMIYITYICTGS